MFKSFTKSSRSDCDINFDILKSGKLTTPSKMSIDETTLLVSVTMQLSSGAGGIGIGNKNEECIVYLMKDFGIEH